MIQINLLPAEFKKAEPQEMPLGRWVNVRGLAYFLIFLLIFEIAFFFKASALDAPRIKKLEAEMASLEPQLKVVRLLKGKLGGIHRTRRELLSWMERPFYWTEVLTDIADSIVPGVWLSHVKLEQLEFDIAVEADKKQKGRVQRNPKEKRIVLVMEGRTSISGEATATIGRFIQTLKMHDNFSSIMDDVVLSNIKRVKVDNNKYLFDFSIHCMVKRELQGEFYDVS